MRRLTAFVAMGMLCGWSCAMAQQAAPATAAQSDSWVQVSTQPSDVPPLPSSMTANPALWRVQGVHGTVYLFGSIHVMKPDVQWETEKVKAAFDASDVVYEEVANVDDSSAAMPMMMKLGMDAAHPLSTKISKDDLALLDAAAKSMGLPGEQIFEPMQPWMVSVSLAVVPMLKAGYAQKSGVDMALLGQSKDAQKKVLGFETVDDQMHMMADMPQAEQVKLLHKDLTEMDKSAAEIDEMVAAWEQGDVEKIGKMENDELAVKLPDEYKRLVVDRNRRWTATLDGLLKDKATGNVFVVVGAGHLAGPDSVLKMLEKDGYKVVRQ